MSGIFANASVILDVFENNPDWADGSEAAINNQSFSFKKNPSESEQNRAIISPMFKFSRAL